MIIRVMTYNVRSGIGMDGKYGLDRIADTIGQAAPDVVGLQEIGQHWDAQTKWEDQVEGLASRLNMAGMMQPIYTLEPTEGQTVTRSFGCATLTRLPVHASVNHHLTRISTFSPDKVPHLMPGFGEVVLAVGNRRLRFYNTHLYWKSQALRCQEIDEMAAITAQTSDPFVLVGDYNARPEDEEIVLASRYASDAWAVAGNGEGYTFPADAPDRRIDFIFTSPTLRVRRAFVIPSQASDHLPVVADIELVSSE